MVGVIMVMMLIMMMPPLHNYEIEFFFYNIRFMSGVETLLPFNYVSIAL